MADFVGECPSYTICSGRCFMHGYVGTRIASSQGPGVSAGAYKIERIRPSVNLLCPAASVQQPIMVLRIQRKRIYRQLASI